MGKSTSLKKLLVSAIMMLALTNAFAVSYATIGELRTAIDALQLPKTGTSNTTTVDYTLSGEAVMSFISTKIVKVGTSVSKVII
jgi:hypothetical protein